MPHGNQRIFKSFADEFHVTVSTVESMPNIVAELYVAHFHNRVAQAGTTDTDCHLGSQSAHAPYWAGRITNITFRWLREAFSADHSPELKMGK